MSDSAGALRRRNGSSEAATLNPDSPQPHKSEPCSSESNVPKPDSNISDSSETDSSKVGTIESEVHEPASGIKTEAEKDYQQHLYRLFGKEKADYFLFPPSDQKEASAWYNLVIEHMGEQVSAVALWDALREHSTSALANQQEDERIYSKVCMDEARQRDRGRLRRLAAVRTMFHLARLRQALSAQLLASRPNSPSTDSSQIPSPASEQEHV